MLKIIRSLDKPTPSRNDGSKPVSSKNNGSKLVFSKNDSSKPAFRRNNGNDEIEFGSNSIKHTKKSGQLKAYFLKKKTLKYLI